MTIKNKMIGEQIEEATILRLDGMSWAKIGAKLGLHWQMVRDTLYPNYAESRKAKQRARMQKVRSGAVVISKRRLHDDTNFSKPGADLLYDRDKRLAVPYKDFTSEWLGDPRPGYSALDKKQRVFG